MAKAMSPQRIGLLLTLSLFIGICIWIFLIWTYGTLIPEPYTSRLRPFLPLISALFVLSGLVALRVEYKREIKGYRLNAFASWLLAITSLIVWMGIVSQAGMWILVLAFALVAASLWIQVRQAMWPAV
jgi:hypothetical protein